MADFPFTDKYGRISYCETELAFVREKGYLIVRKGNKVMCTFDAGGIWKLPSDKEVELNAEPTAEFSLLAYLTENGRPIKEMQTYRVYVVENADLAETIFQWCDIGDILLKKIAFDATQRQGIKNLLVRIKEK